jgi:hypothetical protein
VAVDGRHDALCMFGNVAGDGLLEKREQVREKLSPVTWVSCRYRGKHANSPVLRNHGSSIVGPMSRAVPDSGKTTKRR